MRDLAEELAINRGQALVLRRTSHRRQDLAGQPERLPVMLPRGFRGHDHVVERRERRRVAMRQVVQGENDGNVQPLEQFDDLPRQGVVAVGPHRVRSLLLQEQFAGGESGDTLRVFFFLRPAALLGPQ